MNTQEQAEDTFEYLNRIQRERMNMMEATVHRASSYSQRPKCAQNPGLLLQMLDLQIEFLNDQYRQFLNTHEEMAKYYQIALRRYNKPEDSYLRAFEIYQEAKEKLVVKRYEASVKSTTPSKFADY